MSTVVGHRRPAGRGDPWRSRGWRCIRMACVGLAALGSVHAPSFAAEAAFPSRPIRFIVPFSPGGSTDALARLVAQKMSEHWGQPVVIENRTGASGILGAAAVAKATADGYTLLVSSSSFAIAAAMQPRLPYDPHKDFVGISRIGFSTSVVAVTPSLGVKTLPQFIELARSRPGKILFSSAGAGSSTHLNGEKLRLAAGFKPVHVAFKGSSDAMIEVVAGRVHYVVTGLLVMMPYIKDGRLNALAVVTPNRTPMLPDVPTVAETLPGYKRDGSHVMLAPAGTPMSVREKLSVEVRRILTLPDVQDRMKNFDYVLSPSTPTEMDQILRSDIQTFTEVAVAAGLRPK